jgi:hypothetical protein
MKKNITILLLACFVSSAFALAPVKPKNKVVQSKTVMKTQEEKFPFGAAVGGDIFVEYFKEFKSSSTVPSQFSITRGYIDVKAKLEQDVSVRITPDINYESTLTNSWNVALKYAYFDLGSFSEHMPIFGFAGVQDVIVGQSSTPWISFSEKFWQLRYVAKTLTDFYGFYPSADLGLAAKGELNRIKYHATLMNGNGYKKAETNSGKEASINISAEPFDWGKNAHLITALGYSLQDFSFSSFDINNSVRKISALAGYQYTGDKNGIIYLEYAGQVSSTEGGTSFGIIYGLNEASNLFGRYDHFNKAGDDYALQILGIDYDWSSNVRLALDYQYETRNLADNMKRLYLHSEVKW